MNLIHPKLMNVMQPKSPDKYQGSLIHMKHNIISPIPRIHTFNFGQGSIIMGDGMASWSKGGILFSFGLDVVLALCLICFPSSLRLVFLS
jgi:hypothetical protein